MAGELNYKNTDKKLENKVLQKWKVWYRNEINTTANWCRTKGCTDSNGTHKVRGTAGNNQGWKNNKLGVMTPGQGVELKATQ